VSVGSSSTSVVLTGEQTQRLEWLLAETFERNHLHLEQSTLDPPPTSLNDSTNSSNKDDDDDDGNVTSVVMEFGPRMAFTSAFSSNAVSICQACDIPVVRLEVSRRYRCRFQWPRGDGTSTTSTTTSTQMRMMQVMKSFLHDRMTEEEYTTPLSSFDQSIIPTPTKTIPIMEYGRKALEEINDEMGLGFDDFDLDYYTDLFQV
jgi:phosphoribosylformylglycinamidine synthase